MVFAIATAPQPLRSSQRSTARDDVGSRRGQHLAGGCAFALAVGFAGACNPVLGLDPVVLHVDASSGAIDAIDAPACEPVVAADVGGGAAVDNLFALGVAGAAMHLGRLFLVGTDDSRANDGAFAAIAFPADGSAMWTTRSIGGALNDQLWTVASNGNELLAGGMTRSFQASSFDEGLLMRIDGAGMLTSRRVSAVVNIQLRAISVATAGQWWVAGTAGTANGLLARFDSAATTLGAISFTVDGARPLPRRVVDAPDDSSAPFVVGTLGGGTEGSFVARIDSTPVGGDTSWAITVPMEVFDAAWFDASLWVAGNAGADGVLLRFAADGVLLSSWRLPLRPLQRVDLRNATIWLGGATSTGVFVATLDGDCVTGTDFAMLLPAGPLRTPLPLGVDGAVPFLVGRVDTVARIIPLGEDGTATCGVPFAVLREPATITPTAATYVGATLALSDQSVSAIGAATNVDILATTCPATP